MVRGSSQVEQRRRSVPAFIFGVISVAVVLALTFLANNLDDRRFEILRIVLALAGGGIGGVIPGFLDLHMKHGSTWMLRAGGGLAVFVVMYFWSPARWIAQDSGSTVVQHTSGSNSPTINGSNNTVTPAR